MTVQDHSVVVLIGEQLVFRHFELFIEHVLAHEGVLICSGLEGLQREYFLLDLRINNNRGVFDVHVLVLLF